MPLIMLMHKTRYVVSKVKHVVSGESNLSISKMLLPLCAYCVRAKMHGCCTGVISCYFKSSGLVYKQNWRQIDMLMNEQGIVVHVV